MRIDGVNRKALLIMVSLAGLLVVGPKVTWAALDALKRGRMLPGSDPSDGARRASDLVGRPVTRDAYTLARMVRSEAGRENAVHKAAVAWVARNDARALGRDIVYTITVRRGGTSGAFGSQSGGGRYSTARDPYENDLAVAEAVIAGHVGDPTGGAVKFVHRNVFGLQAGTGTYASVRDRWAKDGLRERIIDGTSGDLVVFVRVGGVA